MRGSATAAQSNVTCRMHGAGGLAAGLQQYALVEIGLQHEASTSRR
jgi:hypothetical protein